MIVHLMPRDFAGGFGLGDDVQKIIPFGVAEKMLNIAGQPILDATLGLLGVGFKGGGEGLDEFGFHFLQRVIYAVTSLSIFRISPSSLLMSVSMTSSGRGGS
jgi:hypothetical protein